MSAFPDNPFATRQDWIDGLRGLLNPALDCLDAGRAGGFPGSSGSFSGSARTRLEAVVRILAGACFLARATGSLPRAETFRRILLNGTDPGHPAYWGEVRDYDQHIVEIAGLALALGLCPESLWEPLDDDQQAQVASWIARTNAAQPVPNNWILFRILTNAVLHRIGHPPAADPSETDWAGIDALYVGHGWYRDGPGGDQFDYYIPKGFHLYSLYAAYFHPALPEDRRERIFDRARAIAPAIAAWQSPDGLVLPFGRSLTYRFAVSAFWGALALHGLGDPAELRERACANLRWWARKPVCDSGGRLTIGFAYPNLNLAENYISPGSPFFAFHAFLPLVLPEDHPFWNPNTRPGKRESGTEITPIPEARQVICNDPDRDHHWALCGGQRANWPLRHHAEKYAKFAYSSRHGFQISGGVRGLNRLGFDNALAVSEEGDYWRLRESPEVEWQADRQGFRSVWDLPGWLRVVTEQAIRNGMEWRSHHIEVFRPLTLVEGGWCFPFDEPAAALDGREENTGPGFASLNRPGTAWFSGIRDAGETPREGSIILCEPNLNVLHNGCAIPYLSERLEPGRYDRESLVAGYGTEADFARTKTSPAS